MELQVLESHENTMTELRKKLDDLRITIRVLQQIAYDEAFINGRPDEADKIDQLWLDLSGWVAEIRVQLAGASYDIELRGDLPMVEVVR